MRGFVGTLLLALVGCGDCADQEVAASPPRKTQQPATIDCAGRYRIEPGFRADQEAAIARGMARWNALAGHAHFRIDPDATCRILVSSEVGDTPFKPVQNWGAFADGYTGRIVVNLESLAKTGYTSGWRFESIVMHEMGHAAGLEGLDSSKGIMGENRDLLVEDFTDADRAECVRAKFCR